MDIVFEEIELGHRLEAIAGRLKDAAHTLRSAPFSAVKNDLLEINADLAEIIKDAFIELLDAEREQTDMELLDAEVEQTDGEWF